MPVAPVISVGSLQARYPRPMPGGYAGFRQIAVSDVCGFDNRCFDMCGCVALIRNLEPSNFVPQHRAFAVSRFAVLLTVSRSRRRGRSSAQSRSTSLSRAPAM
jgi:hypothetical protein